MCEAADQAGKDPDRLSFMRSLRVIRRQVTDHGRFKIVLGSGLAVPRLA
jgi:hypothetical protein